MFSNLVLEKSDPTYISLATRRAERKDLLPRLPAIHQDLKSLFKQEIPVIYNLRDILDKLRLESKISEMVPHEYREEGVLKDALPRIIWRYFHYAVKGLDTRNFGSDALLASSWLQ